jgi:hypothetical protein
VRSGVFGTASGGSQPEIRNKRYWGDLNREIFECKCMLVEIPTSRNKKTHLDKVRPGGKSEQN